MTLKLHYASGSPWAWRVMLALVHKGLAFDAEEIHFSKGDSQTAEYLALNPHGQVPVLQDGDFTLYESGAILAYLDRKYPEKPLFGTTADDAGLIMQRMLELEHHLVPIMRAGVRPFFTGDYENNPEAVHAELAKVAGELSKIENWLGDQDFFFGDISALDLTLYPPLALMQRVLGGPAGVAADTSDFLPYAEKFPGLAAWMLRVEAMPRFDDVYPTHWKQAA